MNYVVEFTGIPGSGKTYISNQLIKFVKTMGEEKAFESYSLYDRNDIYIKRNSHGLRKILALLKVIVRPLYLRLFISVLFRKKYKNARKNKLIYLTKILLQQNFVVKINKKEKSFFVLDEGFMHLQNIFLEGIFNEKEIDRQLHFLDKLFKKYKETKVIKVFVECDWETALKRIDCRSQGWPIGFIGETSMEKASYLQEQTRIHNVIKEHFSEDSNSIIVDSDKCELLLKFIEKKVKEL